MRMLKQLVEFGHKLDEKMKTMLSEIKENVHGTSSDGKETRTQINGVDQKEKRNIHPDWYRGRDGQPGREELQQGGG